MKKFCVVPWYAEEINLTNNNQQACCWTSLAVTSKELQAQFLSQEQPDVCKKCWDLEDSGLESKRQMENRFLDFALDKDIEQLEKDALLNSVPVLYQINLGSLCNGSCIMCGEGASTTWKSLNNTDYKISDLTNKIVKNFQKIKHKINWEGLQRINLLGGEPLLIKQSTEILKILKEHNNTECLVSFVTNGSVTITDKQKELFSEFSKISCCVSIDGIGKQFEYIRYPLKWDNIVQNLEQYKELFYEVTVSFTITNLNYYNKESIIKWFNDNDLKYIENPVVFPPYFRPTVKPGGMLWAEFVEEIKRQDLLKQIDIQDYIPYISKLIKENPIA